MSLSRLSIAKIKITIDISSIVHNIIKMQRSIRKIELVENYYQLRVLTNLTSYSFYLKRKEL